MNKKTLFIVYGILIVVLGFGQEPRLVLPVGHLETIDGAAISPDGTKILTASSDGKAKMWNMQGYELFSVVGFDRFAKTVSFNYDGSLFLVRYENHIAVYQSLDGSLVWSYKEVGNIEYASFLNNKNLVIFHTWFMFGLLDMKGEAVNLLFEDKEIKAIALSKDDRYVALARENRAVQLASLESMTIIDSFSVPNSVVTTIVFDEKSERLALGTDSGKVFVFNKETHDCLLQIKQHDEEIKQVLFNKEGNKLLSAANDGKIIVRNNLSATDTINIQAETVYYGTYFSKDNSQILSYANNAVQVWNLKDGKLAFSLNIYDYHVGSVNDVDFTNLHYVNYSPDGTRIVTTSSDRTAKIWDATNGQFMLTLQGAITQQTRMSFYKPSNLLLSGYINGFIRFWNLSTAKLSKVLRPEESWVTELAVANKKPKAAVGFKNASVSILNLESKTVERSIEAHNRWVVSVQLNTNASKLLTGSWDNTAALWDVQTGKLLTRLRKHKGIINSSVFSKDEKQILTTGDDSLACLWDATSGKLLYIFRVPDYVHDGKFSPDGKMVTAACSDGNLYAWQLIDKKIRYSFKTGGRIIQQKFSTDGKQLFVLTTNNSRFSNDEPGNLFILNAITGAIIHKKEIAGEAGNPVEMEIDETGKQLLVSTENGYLYYFNLSGSKPISTYIETGEAGWNNVIFISKERFVIIFPHGCRYYNIIAEETGNVMLEEICTMMPIDSTDYLTRIPTGYYQCTKGAAKRVYYVTDAQKIITFEQLDVKYNRPDKVLEAIGSKDVELIESYRKAYQKRIKKLNIDTTQFNSGYSVPEADFDNRNTIAYEQKSNNLVLKIKGEDKEYMLSRFNIWINEIPVFGLKGHALNGLNIKRIDTTITVSLSQGENSIETSVTNVNGTESYRMPLHVKFTPETGKVHTPKLHFIGIGMNEFANNKYNLNWSVKDIRDFSVKLKNKYENDIEIDTLFNENVSTEKVKALKQKLLASNINDKVIVAYSGHGMLSKNYDYYLSTFNVNFDKPEENGLAYDELENLLDSIPARQKLMLIDACHSGEVDKEELQKLQAVATSMDSTSNKRINAKGIKLFVDSSHKTIGIKNSFELMQNLFVNVGKGTGATIISAAAGTQFAQERGDLKNGVFTYSILELFEKNKTITVSELKKYVNQRVAEITKGAQQPTSRTETLQNDWRVW